jgi:hypothetical protein
MEATIMPRKKEERWITAREATAILRENNNRPDLSDAYIRSLARDGHVDVKRASENQGPDKRTNLYKASDVEKYRIRQYKKVGTNHVQ